MGARSDPFFFFDLNAFLGAVVGNGNGRTFCDQPGAVKGVDFFAPLNVNSIVLQVHRDVITALDHGDAALAESAISSHIHAARYAARRLADDTTTV